MAKIKNCILIISSITFMILISNASKLSWILNFALGIIIGIFSCYFLSKHIIKNRTIKILNFIISLYFIWGTGNTFYISWKDAPLANVVLSKFSAKTSALPLFMIGCLCIIAFPIIYLMISVLLDYFFQACRVTFNKSLFSALFNDSKNSLKKFAAIILNILLASFIGILLLDCVYKLPLQNIDKNVEKSSTIFATEGNNPTMFSWCNSMLDNYTDGIMLGEAADNSSSSSIENAIMAYRGVFEKKSSSEALVLHYIDNEEYPEKASYSRYWHGYHIFLKPLLEVMTYQNIRILNLAIQVILTLIVCLLFRKRGLKFYDISYFCGYLMLMPLALGNNLQFSSCFYAFTFGTIILLLLPNEMRGKYSFLVFLNIGILTAYFDFLTYPIATFGVPAVVYVAIQAEDSLENKIASLIKNGLSWCFGYAGMWVMKWILSYLLIGYNTFAEASSSIAFRTSNTTNDGTKISKLVCILMNFRTFIFTPAAIIFILFIILLVIELKKKSKRSATETITTIAPYIFLGLLPILWYLFATNHSYIHCYFTNKSCIITFLAIAFCLSDVLNRFSKTQQP